MEIIYRFFNANSESEIVQWLDLYQVCFQHTVSREFWHWIHMENPFYSRTKPLIFIAEINKRIVGSVSLIPSPLQVSINRGHSSINSCILCKAMVHPEFRGLGIFSSLLKNAIKHSKEEDYDLIITFSNNPYSYHSFIKEGFVSITSIRQSKFYISQDGLLKKYTNFLPEQIRRRINHSLTYFYSLLLPKIHNNFRINYNEISEVFEEIDKLYSSEQTVTGIFGVRTSNFIRWRLSYGGMHFKCLSIRDDEKILAYLILEFPHDGKSVLIADLFARENDETLILILIREAIAILKKDKFDSVWTYLVERDWNFSRIFSLRYGFIPHHSGAENKLKLQFLYYELKDSQCNVDFSDKNQWNLQSVDSCLFWVK